MLREVASRVLRVLREEGLTTLAYKAAMLAKYSLRQRDDKFDVGRNIDTTREIPLWRLRIHSENAKFGFRYQPSDPAFFLDVLRAVPADFKDLTFIDLGCGKGRVLLMAFQQGFKKVVGVEFSHELVAIAKANMTAAGTAAEVVEGDASEFQFPDENLLVYMYNPFGCPVMDSVIKNLLMWRQTTNKMAFIAYLNPKYRDKFDVVPEFSQVLSEGRVCLWRLDRAA
jgi:SAM-dependent methyltransferase